MYVGPFLVVGICILSVATRQPRGVSVTCVCLTLVAGIAYVATWGLAGAGEVTGFYVALAICVIAGGGVVGIGAARLISSAKAVRVEARAAV
jgi:hypothetical protein